MNVSHDLTPIAAACERYVGITEQAECALIALAMVGITGPAATRIAAGAAAEAAATYNANRRAAYTLDYIPTDTARRMEERSLVIDRLRAIAAQPLRAAA